MTPILEELANVSLRINYLPFAGASSYLGARSHLLLLNDNGGKLVQHTLLESLELIN